MPPAPRPANRKRTLKILLYGVLPTLLLLTGAVLFQRHRANRQVEAMLAVYREAGYPTTLEGWKDWGPDPIPPEENAATLYKKAFPLVDQIDWMPILEAQGISFSDQPLNGVATLTPEGRRAISKILTENQAARDTLAEASRRPRTVFPIDYSDHSFKLSASLLPDLKQCATLCLYEALLKAEEKDQAGTIRAMESLLAVQEALAEDPTWIGFMVRIAVLGMTNQGLQHALNVQVLDEPQLAHLQKRIRDLEPELNLQPFMAHEMALGMEILKAPSKILPQSDAGDSLMKMVTTRLIRLSVNISETKRAFLAHHLSLWRAQEIPFPERLDRAESVDAEILQEVDSAFTEYRYDFLDPRLSSLINTMERHARTVALLGMLDIALALERYRRLHDGSLPESPNAIPESLLPNQPTDPFTGHPFLFELLDEGRGYRLTSLGPDRERGATLVADDKSNNFSEVDDVIFTLRN